MGAGQVPQLLASAAAAVPFAQVGLVSIDAAMIVMPAQLVGIRLGVGIAHVVQPRLAARAVAVLGAGAGVGVLVAALRA